MTIKEVLKLENNAERDKNVIYLIQDGDSSPWYRAYNWSAYLLEFYPNNLEEFNRLKVTKRKIKSEKGVTIASVGLQETSFYKYMPGCSFDKTTSKNLVKIRIKPKDYDKDFFTESSYNNWLESIELSESRGEKIDTTDKSSTKHPNIYSQPTTFCSIMKSIIRFDTRNKDIDELVDFILQLKQECANLI